MKFEQVIWIIGLGVLGWGSLQLYQMNANVAVISYKVDENHKMIKPLWEEFLSLNKVAGK
jgi:hypothetical protein